MITLSMQAAQDINVGARLSKTQYTLVDVGSAGRLLKPFSLYAPAESTIRGRKTWSVGT
jgi:hypothetical protein